jgi:nucleoid-associated protein YgaU
VYYFAKPLASVPSFWSRINPDVRSCPPVNVQLIWLESMRHKGPISRRLRFLRASCVPLVVCSVGISAFTLPVRAQDAAEVARQNQARKAKEDRPPEHVYTNDDLKRAHILTPQDQARVEARKKNSPPPAAVQPPLTLDAGSPAESLGEVARRYRREKAEREAEQALKNQPSRFPLKLPATSLATPKPFVAPGDATRWPMIRNNRGIRAPRPSRIAPALPSPASVSPRVLPAPRYSPAPKRISPFAPRPLLAPVLPSRSIPAVNGSELRRVIVKRGDSFWKLSREYLGRGARWQELLAFNPGWNDPHRLTAGSEIFVPRNAVASVSASNSASRVTVRKGDTLWSIARSHFGRGAAWTCLASANPSVHNPDFILPGEQLFVPSSCTPGP